MKYKIEFEDGTSSIQDIYNAQDAYYAGIIEKASTLEDGIECPKIVKISGIDCIKLSDVSDVLSSLKLAGKKGK